MSGCRTDGCDSGSMLILGIGVREAILSTLFFVCETCGNQGAHQIIRRTRKLSVFFIPLLTVGTTYLDVCNVCGRVQEISREQAETASQQTGPELR